jgi:hypothetical protein
MCTYLPCADGPRRSSWHRKQHHQQGPHDRDWRGCQSPWPGCTGCTGRLCCLGSYCQYLTSKRAVWWDVDIPNQPIVYVFYGNLMRFGCDGLLQNCTLCCRSFELLMERRRMRRQGGIYVWIPERPSVIAPPGDKTANNKVVGQQKSVSLWLVWIEASPIFQLSKGLKTQVHANPFDSRID